MAERVRRQSSTKQQKTGSLTLVELLNEPQPYKEIDRLQDSELDISDDDKLRRIQGSLVGLAVGDALGASVEFRPHAYLEQHPVSDMQSGGTWGLEAGQWTDDTSMALCLAASLIVKGGFNAYDQFDRYRRWYKDGYMSSTGKCFDIGKSTRQAITEFESRLQRTRSRLSRENRQPKDYDYDMMLEYYMSDNGGLKIGTTDSAGNGPLMRLAPIPCFFSQSYDDLKKNIDEATQLTHGDPRAIDACRFYAALIFHAINGTPKKDLLDRNFHKKCLDRPLHKDILDVAEGSYKNKDGYEGGIRGKGYVVNALEAALWAFYNDDDNFDKGVLKAINLGDDTDTTAAIYGELAGAVYGIDKINKRWIQQLYQGKFIMDIAIGLYVKGAKLGKGQRKLDRSEESDKKNRPKSGNDTTHDNRESDQAKTTRSGHSPIPKSSMIKEEQETASNVSQNKKHVLPEPN